MSKKQQLKLWHETSGENPAETGIKQNGANALADILPSLEAVFASNRHPPVYKTQEGYEYTYYLTYISKI